MTYTSQERKLPTLYIEAGYEVTLDYVFTIPRHYGGYACYTDCGEIVNSLLNDAPTQKITMMQYNIPEDHQEKMFKLSQKKGVKGIINGISNSFCPTKKVPIGDILHYDYYAGYWEYSKNTETNEIYSTFTPCDLFLKQAFLDNKHLLQINKQLDEVNNEIQLNERRFELGAVVALFSILFSDKLSVLFSTSFYVMNVQHLFNELAEYKANNEQAVQMEKTRDTIVSNHRLFAKSNNREPLLQHETIIENKVTRSVLDCPELSEEFVGCGMI
jgi:hypothetical protein